ncbi:MAG TPA: hypothetical protein VF808_09015 [Ktedonobacterales bacterium]
MTLGGEGSGGDERRKRQDALRALAGEVSQPSATDEGGQRAPGATRGRIPGWRRWLISATGALALVAIVGVVFTHALPAPAPKGPSTQSSAILALDPETYGIACLQDAAWSPDGAKIAILGTVENCSQPNPFSYSYYPTAVVIVDATTGRRLTTLQPDVTVQRDLHLHAPQYITPENGLANSGDLTKQGVSYDGVLWSPDGQSVALPFNLEFAAAPGASGSSEPVIATMQGVCISAIDGASARAFGAILTTQSPIDNEWNVKTGKPVMASPSSDSYLNGTSAQLLPASLNYSWQADGALAGADALNSHNPPARSPLGPIGNPDGAASFTVWQPMAIQRNAGGPPDFQTAAAFEASSEFVAWSPNGTYLLTSSYDWRIQPSKQPTPSALQLEREGVASLPLLPIRDAAMDAMLSPLPGGQPQQYVSSGFAWSPDGKMLAAIANGGVVSAQADVTVLIIDCASGKTLSTVQVGSTSSANGNLQIGPGVKWAPDGRKLLVGAESELFVVVPRMLPHS